MEPTASNPATLGPQPLAANATPMNPLFGRARTDDDTPTPGADAQAWIGVFRGDVHEDFPGFEGLFSHPALRPAARFASSLAGGEEFAGARRSAAEPVAAL